jgi:hypothetical protein
MTTTGRCGGSNLPSIWHASLDEGRPSCTALWIVATMSPGTRSDRASAAVAGAAYLPFAGGRWGDVAMGRLLQGGGTT